MKLYELNEEYRAAVEGLSDIEDLDQSIIDDTLSAIKGQLNDKCLSVAAYIANLEAEEQAVKEAAKSMGERAKALSNKAKSMRDYLTNTMVSCETGPLKNDQLTIRVNKGRERVVVDDINLLPPECTKTEVKAVAAEVKKNMDSLPEGAAHIEAGNPSVTIK